MTDDGQIIELNNKLLRLETELNRYVSISEEKDVEINNIRIHYENLIGE